MLSILLGEKENASTIELITDGEYLASSKDVAQLYVRL